MAEHSSPRSAETAAPSLAQEVHPLQWLLTRYPRLETALPCVDLRVHRSPLERWQLEGASLLVKRDDLSAPTLGGNKVRALEVLLAGRGPDDTLLTVGSEGSTHALAVAHYGGRLGARVEVFTWPQVMHEVARSTAERLRRAAQVTASHSPVEAYLRAAVRRAARGRRWIPAGGRSAAGTLGHVNAALELVEQLAAAGCAPPDAVVVPLGTGGTAAGLLLGLAVAGLPTRVVGVRVVPRLVARRGAVLSLARRARALLQRLAGEPLPPLDATRLEVEHAAYGGTYGCETDAARAAAESAWREYGVRLECTYSAKTFAVALGRARANAGDRVLFWLTFDGRWLAGDPAAAEHSPSCLEWR